MTMDRMGLSDLPEDLKALARLALEESQLLGAN